MTEPQPSKKRKGLILKEAREAKGIDLMTVHEVTKIPMDVLRAIEEDYQVRTLSSFYVKGFMKMYAQYLGIDVCEIIEDYQPEVIPPPVTEREPQEKIELTIKELLPKSRQQKIIKGIGVIIALFLVGRMVGCMIHKRRVAGSTPPKATAGTQSKTKDVKKEKKEQSKPTSDVKEKKETAQAKKQTPPQVQVKPPAAASQKKVKKSTPQPKNVNLTIRAKRKVWLQVKVDGNIVFQSTLQKGAAESWQADKTIELSGRNITHLEFELNGKILGDLGRTDRKARRVEITKDGLTIKQ